MKKPSTKPAGTYWCNHCEDNAFSETCWRCHREAILIPSTTGTPKPRFGAKPRFGVQYITPPAEWFRRMRQAINP
jgi:hypothetical protein